MSSSVVEINYTPPGGSVQDVTNHAIWRQCSFESQQNAQPGTFEVTLRDLDRTLGPFDTGGELTLDVDGVRLFGGYVTQVGRRFALPADELPTDSRLWVLRGVDYNILFDKRVTIRNDSVPSSPQNLRRLPLFHGDEYDGDLIKHFASNFITPLTGFDVTTEVDNVALPFNLSAPDPDRVGGWRQQGTPWREQMELIAEWSASVWYISPDKKLHFHAIEDDDAPFGFSDTPNGTTTIGMRDVTATEDASQMVNDALVWGGSEWTEGAVFARSQNTTSISDHNRWQVAEHHFGEDGYKLDTQWRADLITEGHSAVVGFNPGLAYPQWQLSLTWFGEDVPGNAHLRAGQLVDVSLTSFGGALSPMTLPMRSVRIGFVGVDSAGKGHVQFSGQLGLQLNDPYSIWGYLRRLARRRARSVVAASTNATADSTTYGGFGQFEPTQVTGTIYDLPGEAGYIEGTTMVYVDGVLLARNTDYTESDPVAGEITFASSPAGWVWVTCRTT